MISIIIVTYNRCESLKDTLDSLLNQEPNGNFDYEVIVVDNNSKDKTKEVVERYKPKLNGRLKYLFESKQGRSYALNRGIEVAKGEIIAFTDDDCIVDKRWLTNIKKIFDEHIDIDIAGGRIIPIFTTKIPKWLENYKDNFLQFPLIYFDLGDKYLEINEARFFPLGANTIIKKSSYYKFGRFTYSSRVQDIELCNRWHKLGAKIVYCPEVVIYHHTLHSRLTKRHFRKWFLDAGASNHCIFGKTHIKERRFFSIPLWQYKELILNILRFLKSVMLFKKDLFVEELSIWFTLGKVLDSRHNYTVKNDN